ncbi:MAG: sigma-54-dependent Fis family transcriptional regulator [Gemmatimonadaceae bacterium]|jgi:DNA-binding NtrC family response regulator|nr:sigma-54-dependent Fis family transcriptional regulator [Gemmatimonadaceae bacterium]
MTMTSTGSGTSGASQRWGASADVMETGRVLVAEDDAALRELLVEVLTGAGHRVIAVPNGAEALARLQHNESVDAVLTDLIMPGIGGEAVLAGVRERAPRIPVIVMTAFGSVESAVRLVRAGAFDYVTKPVGTAELLHAISRAVTQSKRAAVEARAEATLSAEEAAAPSAMLRQRVFGSLVAESASMQSLLRLVERVAVSKHPVLLTGESGTGKEVLAHAIHALSQRGPFIVVNCGAIPEQLIESELFGHERGAYTGADRERQGLVAAADGGTLFLDEIGELPLALQPALLRFLESGEARRVGATATRHYDVRVIAATHRDLEGEMATGRFREDLFWRLNVLPLDVAPLRERVDDVLPLARRFLSESGGSHVLDPASETLLTTYAWPGNVRELRNAMHRAATFSSGPVVMPDELPPRLREANRAAALVAHASQQQLPLRAVERAYVLEIVRRTDGNKSRAAEILGLDRKTLYRKLAEYADEPDTSDAVEEAS